jgi:hypothetical protein
MRNSGAPACISTFFADAASVLALMKALAGEGKNVLLVDTSGRQLAAGRTRSLFDWRRQLEQMRLQGLPLAHGDGLSAEGAAAGDGAILAAAGTYDIVLFDAGPAGPSIDLAAGVLQDLVLQLDGDSQSLEWGYAVLKSLPRAQHDGDVLLSGPASVCERLVAAARHFLGEPAAARIWTAGDDDPHFLALAARIAAEEAGRQVRREAGVPARHG